VFALLHKTELATAKRRNFMMLLGCADGMISLHKMWKIKLLDFFPAFQSFVSLV
jgi:hypothetical protein